MLSSSTIEPGDRGEIRATVLTTGKKGRLTKSIRVRSNDPARPMVSLVITLNVTLHNDAGSGKSSSQN